MPAAEVEIDEHLVRRLLTDQHPDLASLPLEPVAFGWDNVVYRLGVDLTVRLPRRAMAAELVEHEQRWLPQLAPRLPLPVPAPVRVGLPTADYPWRWTIGPWLPGRIAADEPPADLAAAAGALGEFVHALREPAPPDAPVNPYRGCPLVDRAGPTEDRLRALDAAIDAGRVRALWHALLETPSWTGPRMWLHGDLHPANILVSHGAISAVIDFGDVAAGDPASDLAVAWMMFPPTERAVFRAAADPTGDLDDDTWRRARGWAIVLALACLAASADNPLMARIGAVTLAAALDHSADAALP